MTWKLTRLAIPAALACAISVPAGATETQVTRAQLHAELAALQQVGYRPSRLNYPEDVQKALVRLQARGDDQAPGEHPACCAHGILRLGE